ncbi:MAG: type III polyketide synthase [Bacteroidetes bacterium]|nr:type III polyketide synthase [Bacteroidota bacterium]
MSVICKIATAVPSNKYEQSHLAGFMSDFLNHSDSQKRKLKLMYGKSGIDTRYSVIPDFDCALEKRKFFSNTKNLEPFPTIEHRMQYYNKTALPICIEAIENCFTKKISKQQITHLITVSCTGLSAPGLDIDIVQHFKLNENVNRTSINFMGCYAAIHALKQADYICKSEEDAIVLIVCVELCTIHFQKIDDLDNSTANLLFADGVAATLIISDDYASKNKINGFKIKKFHSQVSLKGKNDMAWELTSTGFLMTLSAYIPQLIQKDIKAFFEKAISQHGINKQEVTHWAVHPGGRKILEVIQKELALEKGDLESSFRVLKNYGNMSSSTFLFVLKDIFETKVNTQKKEKTFGVAFGPGLTMESVILENV